MKPIGLKINEIRELFALWPKSTVHWLIANREALIYASPDAEHKLGIGCGQKVTEHPLVHKAIISKRALVEQHQSWQKDQLVSTTVVAVPMETEGMDDGYVLVYGVDNTPSSEKTGEITSLIQDMNRQTSSMAALQLFVQACLKLFGCQMAAIWVARSEKYYLLAKSALSSEDEECLSELTAAGFSRKGRNQDEVLDWGNAQPYEFSGQPVDELVSILYHQFDRPGFKHVLSFPLRYLGEDLGILGLFTNDARAFDGSAMLWLNQLGPVAASMVHEQEMRALALEREKDLNLLLWGNEILVQAGTEAELLGEAGEMAMVLNLEAGFFFMRKADGWQVQAPFGRLKQNPSGWEYWIFNELKINPDNYNGHKETNVHVLKPAWSGQAADFPWRKLLIQPVETNSGIIGELWLLDFVNTKLEKSKEVFAAFARSLGVALETIRQRQQLERIATTDPLTGALNRQGFSQRFRAEMASTKRHKSACLYLLLDLDEFKKLNDTKGHPVGDKALRTITANIQASIRENDILARSGGDEFVLVLSDMKKGAEADRIINRLKTRMGLEEFELGVSIGVAEYPTEAADYEQLNHLADERLYKGKNSGKNKIIFE